LDALVVDIGANGAHDPSSFVAEDRRWIGEAGEQVCLPDEFLVSLYQWHAMGWMRGCCVLTVWQMPEYFISIRNSSLRISSRMMGVSVKGALGASTTKASVSMFVV
jgi:hypothetical protein